MKINYRILIIMNFLIRLMTSKIINNNKKNNKKNKKYL